MKSFLYYSRDYDRLTAEENQLLQQDVDLVGKAVTLSNRLNKKNLHLRNAHATSYGFVRGTFTSVDNEIGSMAEYLGGEHLKVILRFSHPNFKTIKPTGEYQMYGCSVKIYNAQTPVSAKFPLVNFPVFITNNVSKFLKVHINANRYIIAKEKTFSISWFALPALIFAGLKLFFDREIFSILRNVVRALDIEKQFIATYDFHSVGCYRFGNRMMKVRLKPNFKKVIVKGAALNQRQLLREYFSENELTFDFQVQMATDSKKTPINNLLKLWREKDSKFITVGKIKLDKQDISKYQTLSYENLSFNPFENPDELKPVGRLQKTRQEVYNKSVATRQSLNS